MTVDELCRLRAELATMHTLYDRELKAALGLRADLTEMEHLKDDRERTLALALAAVGRLEKELATDSATTREPHDH